MYRVLVPVDEDVDRAVSQAGYVTDLPAAAENVEAVLLFVFTGDDGDLPSEMQQFKTADRIQSVRRARTTSRTTASRPSSATTPGTPLTTSSRRPRSTTWTPSFSAAGSARPREGYLRERHAVGHPEHRPPGRRHREEQLRRC